MSQVRSYQTSKNNNGLSATKITSDTLLTAGRSLEGTLATGIGSRGGPNKVSNKLKRCPNSYFSF